MRVATYAPYDISQASLQPGRMAVGGVRRDGSSGPPDVFGFVAEGDLGEIYDADWPPRSVPIPAREMPRASPERAGAPMNGYSPSPSSIEHPGPMNSVPADTAPTNTARGYDDPEMQADEVMHMKQRLRQLLQRREMIIREIDSIPFMENRAADLERELDELRAEIDSLKNHQQEIGARLAPLTERMRKMVVVQRPMEAELQSLRQEAFDNLEALFKLRYLLSRERHRAIDMGFQADAKGLEANRLRVLEKRLQLLGTEQEQNLRANFQGRMKALQDRLATINQQREEMVPVADALIARHAALEDNKTVLQTAIDNAKSKVTNMEAKFIALEREVETKMQETEVFEHEVKKTKAMAEQDFSGLVRWLRPETASIAMPPPPPMVVPEVPPSRVSGAPAYPPVVAPAAAAAAYPTPASLGPSSGPSSGPSGPSPYPYGDAHSAPVVAKITSPVTPLPKMGSAGDITASAASAMSAGSAASGDALARLRVTEADISIDYNRKLGEGGFGVVYEGILKGATRVAVKVSCGLGRCMIARYLTDVYLQTIKGEVSPKTMSVFLKEVSVWNGLNQRNSGHRLAPSERTLSNATLIFQFFRCWHSVSRHRS